MHYPNTKKLSIAYNASKISNEIDLLGLSGYQYYDVIPLRSPAHLVDRSLPQPPPVLDYADGTWTPWLNTPELDKLPYIKQIIEDLQKHCTVNLVRLMRLAPKSTIKQHTDPTLGLHIEKSMVRLTIPVTSNKEALFQLGNELIEMKQGECWYLNLTLPHQIENKGNNERINLSIDVIPNDWVISLITA